MKGSGAVVWLWIIAGFNLIVGGIITLRAQEELDSFSPDPGAVASSALGLDLMSFGAVAVVVALAAQAIVGAIAEAGRGK